MFPFQFAWNPWTLFFLVLTLPPWIAAFIFSLRYIHKDQLLFYFFFISTFFANIVIFFSGNFLTLLIVFEMISLFSIPLVFYEKSKEAIRAGKIYFLFSLLSGILVFAGTMVLYAIPDSSIAYILMSIGFLIKCGAYPFHVWLPEAHPVAPSPASAILSGCIIKVGFYGLFQVILAWNPSEHIGFSLLVLSLITMLYGVLQALFQTNAKKMLAYHSVSQMGYILLGLALYVITKESVPLTGSLMHAMNHAYFKSALFLAIGILYLDSHTFNMYKMKGYFKKAPWVSLLFLIAVLGITGTPFFNGFVSKTFIHEELLIEPLFIFKLAESIFLFTAIGTFVSNFKMYYLICLRPPPPCLRIRKCFREIFPLSFLALCILGFGLYPLLEEKILPMKILVHAGELLEELSPFHKLFLSNLIGYLWIAAAGISLIYVGLKWEWFHKKIPIWIDPLFWFFVFYNCFMNGFLHLLHAMEIGIIYFYSWLTRKLNRLIEFNSQIDSSIARSYQRLYQSQIRSFYHHSQYEISLNKAISFALLPGGRSVSALSSDFLNRIDTKLQGSYGKMVQLVRFLFTVSNKQEIKNSLFYEEFLKSKGKFIVITLAVVSVVLIISFIWLYGVFVGWK